MKKQPLKVKIMNIIYKRGVIPLKKLANELNCSEKEILNNINRKYHIIYEYLTGKWIACKYHLTREIPE